MMPSNEIFAVFVKSENVQEKYLATTSCNIYGISYLAIYRLCNFKQLKQDMKSRCNPNFL